MIVHENVEQGSEEWFILRAGRPTGSSFKKLVSSTGQKSTQMKEYAAQLAAEQYAGMLLYEWGGNSFTERGKQLEGMARDWYEFERDCEVQEVGFITDDDNTHGVSPDGLVGDDGLVEIKCQIAKKHTMSVRYVIERKKPPTDFASQIYGQLMVTERDWCDLVLFHPNLPSLAFRVYRNPEFEAVLAEQINACIVERDKFIGMYKSMPAFIG